MKPIIFDEKSWKFNKNDKALNPLVLYQIIDQVKRTFGCYGYIYLNEIYKRFAIEWNPDDENICYKSANGPIEISYSLIGSDVYEIHITQ